MRFPQVIYVNKDNVMETLGAYATQFSAVNDEGEWEQIGVYELREIRKVHKIAEQQERAKKS